MGSWILEDKYLDSTNIENQSINYPNNRWIYELLYISMEKEKAK